MFFVTHQTAICSRRRRVGNATIEMASSAMRYINNSSYYEHGCAARIFPRKLEVWDVWAPNRTLFGMDSRAVYSGDFQEVRTPKSTISVTDLSRRCTVGKLMISRRGVAPSMQYHSPWKPPFQTTWGPATWIFPRKLEIWKIWTPNRTLFRHGF